MSDLPVRQIPFVDASGAERTLDDVGADVVLVVNVASKCGLTPQYAQLEQLQREYADRGFTVLGFPCNQFLGQEPGSMEQILDFCSTTYGVSFPVNEKVKVNGKNAADLYKALKQTPDAEGSAGRVSWNFEKFLVAPDGAVQRFRPKQKPDSPEIVAAIEAALVR
ncbi:glutathione peroxidase [Microbacterium esteraromaticum]|uniref:Glutathione peroxidase n=1 Tax=Microbacterium esteraromaticum TaxID=57043 RepID=A0A939DWL4_9MICO|nr:glutathione peroxidase [Microbacterium esteraromaticum]MBN7792327.1 glutathione peroxidase [Microbacterium esteraromaticum]MBN8206337.1 glutathione peroxidase [Microbacterium esteraromaticum]MBN8416492.1 glutathione peroxidase [Microbacterium esteraromaticum]MBY6061061.1 glutathione peroxidase [Microbacterium esteraromaticum]WDH77622.1 glutathione peroxidase [Microbacterium esteraromaticum]